MKLPWDRNWFKGCFYLIFTFTIIYIIKQIIDICAYTLINASGVAQVILRAGKQLAGVFAPVLIALAAFYVLEPLVALIRKRVKSRAAACCITFAMLILPIAISFIIVFLHLRVAGEGSLSGGISRCISEGIKRLDIMYLSITCFLKETGLSFLQPYLENLLSKGGSYKASSMDIIRLFVICILNFLLGMVMAFYLLIREKPFGRLWEITRMLLPKGLYKRLKIIGEDFDVVFSGYIRGQLTDGLIMSVLISLGLWLVKIPFAPVIGIISGFSNVVPYFGSIMGFVLTGIAVVVSGDYIRLLYGFGVMLVLQQIDSVLIVPKIVGKRVEISPFGVIAALTVGGKLLGIWGLVLAVPITAVFKVIIIRIYERKANEG